MVKKLCAVVPVQPRATHRLTLRPFHARDANDVQRMASNIDVASTTLVIPHPYLDGIAEAWIKTHESEAIEGRAFHFAMESHESGKLMGAISLDLVKAHQRANLGYWVGKEFWNQGYCSEAAKRMIEFAFQDLKLKKVCAFHLAINPASGKVMQKAGMTEEGYFKKHILKNGIFQDCVYYGILAE